MARKLAASGINAEGIAKALNISRPTVDAIKNRDDEFASALKKGRAENYLECFDSLKNSDISATGFIYLTRTLFKEFYPQEDKQDAPAPLHITVKSDEPLNI